MNYKEFIQKYEELLNSGYCECNELNCLDNNPPKKILNIMKEQQQEIERLNNIIKEVREYLTDEGVCILNKGKKENERLVWTWENYYDLLEILKGSDIE